MERYGKVWYGMVWYGMVWYGMVWYGMVWYGMVWYGMVWCDSYTTLCYAAILCYVAFCSERSRMIVIMKKCSI